MAQPVTTLPARHLQGSGPVVLRLLGDAISMDGLGERWPRRRVCVLGAAGEQLVAAFGANVDAWAGEAGAGVSAAHGAACSPPQALQGETAPGSHRRRCGAESLAEVWDREPPSHGRRGPAGRDSAGPPPAEVWGRSHLHTRLAAAWPQHPGRCAARQEAGQLRRTPRAPPFPRALRGKNSEQEPPGAVSALTHHPDGFFRDSETGRRGWTGASGCRGQVRADFHTGQSRLRMTGDPQGSQGRAVPSSLCLTAQPPQTAGQLTPQTPSQAGPGQSRPSTYFYQISPHQASPAVKRTRAMPQTTQALRAKVIG